MKLKSRHQQFPDQKALLVLMPRRRQSFTTEATIAIKYK